MPDIDVCYNVLSELVANSNGSTVEITSVLAASLLTVLHIMRQSGCRECMDDSTDTARLSDELGEHFCIPCDMCQKWFGSKDCPEQVERCNGKKHWRMLLERIIDA